MRPCYTVQFSQQQLSRNATRAEQKIRSVRIHPCLLEGCNPGEVLLPPGGGTSYIRMIGMIVLFFRVEIGDLVFFRFVC